MYTAEERRRAAEQLGELGWSADSWNAWSPARRDAETQSILTGSGILIPAARMVDIQCDLNRAEILLERATYILPTEGGLLRDIETFLAHIGDGQ